MVRLSKNKNAGQQMIEYMLLLACVITVLVVFVLKQGPGAVFKNNFEGSLAQGVKAIECMANTACFDLTTGCSPVCGNGCCEPGESMSGAGVGDAPWRPCAADCPPAGCVPTVTSCLSGGVQSCGLFNNGCNVVDCGSCPDHGLPVCYNNQCFDCSAPICPSGACGIISDPACGVSLDCGGCSSGDICLGNSCVNCSYTSCQPGDCGTINLGACPPLNCGSCPGGGPCHANQCINCSGYVCQPGDCGRIFFGGIGCPPYIDCPDDCATFGSTCNHSTNRCDCGLGCW
ncbi:MAG: hypothetical protein KBD53_04565 [Candidatus Omnitrophica bacterium]|nr:hypothetical protein [Candidatus Omnitrophota bacterium]